MPPVRRLASVVSAIALALVFAPSCREPTKITVELRTDVPCAVARGVRLAAGAPGTVEDAPPKIDTRRCEPGSPTSEIGTVVVVPETSDGARVAFRAVMGVRVGVEECTPERNYAGCIVQRRELAYLENRALVLPIHFLAECEDLPCDARTTCAPGRRCVSSAIVPTDCLPPRVCLPADPTPDPTASPDASDAIDASPNDAGAALSDAGEAGAGDAGAGDAGETGDLELLCPGSVSGTCTAGTQWCCWDSATGSGLCVPAESPCTAARIRCTRNEHCPKGQHCCLLPGERNETYCSPPQCAIGTACTANEHCEYLSPAAQCEHIYGNEFFGRCEVH